MFKFFSELKKTVSELSEQVKSLISERGALERRHQGELERLERLHEREADIYKERIASLENLNERLLRISGVDSLDKLNKADQEPQQPLETVQPRTASSITGTLIERDKEKERRKQAQEQHAFQVFAQQFYQVNGRWPTEQDIIQHTLSQYENE